MLIVEPCTVPQTLHLEAVSSETATISWRAPRKNNGIEVIYVNCGQYLFRRVMLFNSHKNHHHSFAIGVNIDAVKVNVLQSPICRPTPGIIGDYRIFIWFVVDILCAYRLNTILVLLQCRNRYDFVQKLGGVTKMNRVLLRLIINSCQQHLYHCTKWVLSAKHRHISRVVSPTVRGIYTCNNLIYDIRSLPYVLRALLTQICKYLHNWTCFRTFIIDNIYGVVQVI